MTDLEIQEIKAKAFDEICAAIERPGNIIRNLSGWAFDVYQIYKKFKGDLKQ